MSRSLPKSIERFVEYSSQSVSDLASLSRASLGSPIGNEPPAGCAPSSHEFAAPECGDIKVSQGKPLPVLTPRLEATMPAGRDTGRVVRLDGTDDVRLLRQLDRQFLKEGCESLPRRLRPTVPRSALSSHAPRCRSQRESEQCPERARYSRRRSAEFPEECALSSRTWA